MSIFESLVCQFATRLLRWTPQEATAFYRALLFRPTGADDFYVALDAHFRAFAVRYIVIHAIPYSIMIAVIFHV